MKSRGPQRAEPTGAPRPLEKRTLTVWKERPARARARRRPRRRSARAVQVHPQAAARGGLDFPHALPGPDAAAAAVVGVFHADELGDGEVLVRRAQGGEHIVGAEDTPNARQAAAGGAREESAAGAPPTRSSTRARWHR